MVRLLFLKRKHTSSWADAVRAFNGGGTAAANYRERVMNRLSKVRWAAKAKTPTRADKL